MKFTGIIPTFYVDKLGGKAGKSNGFFIRILKKYKDDIGIHQHELRHCKQFFLIGFISMAIYFIMVSGIMYGFDTNLMFSNLKTNPLILTPFLIVVHSILTLISDKYRYLVELDAYRVQMGYNPARKDKLLYARYYAKIIATKYKLKNVDVEKTAKKLME
jgi:hypothetical protein